MRMLIPFLPPSNSPTNSSEKCSLYPIIIKNRKKKVYLKFFSKDFALISFINGVVIQ